MYESNDKKLKEYKLLISHVGKDSKLALKIVDVIKEKSEESEVSDNFIITPIFMESKTDGCVGDFMDWSAKAVKTSHGVLALVTDNTVENKISVEGKKANDKVVYDEISLARECLKDIIILKNETTNLDDAFDLLTKRLKMISFIANSESLDEKIGEALNDVVIHARHRFAGSPILEYGGNESVNIDFKGMNSIEDTSSYLGRKQELEEIDKHFEANKNIVCISGFGGIGKTTLAKMYADTHPENEVCLIHCSPEDNDLRIPIVNIPMEYDSPKFRGMKIEEKFSTRLKQLEKLSKNTLIIIDNFDTDFSTDANQNAITSLYNLKNKNCRFLISSRQKTERVEVGIVEVGKLSDDELAELFYRDSNCERTEENDVAIRKLIEVTLGHTMTIELGARAVADDENGITPSEIVENLTSATTDIMANLEDRQEGFRNYATIFEHLKALFALTKVSETQKLLLGALSFVSLRGLTLKELKENFDFQKEDLKRLSSLGYISKAKNEEIRYFLHPLMSELCFTEFVQDYEPFDKIIAHVIFDISYSTSDDTANDLEMRFDYGDHLLSRLLKLRESLLSNSTLRWKLRTITLYLGDILEAKGELIQAEKYYKQSYQIDKEIADEMKTASAFRNLSFSLDKLGDIAMENRAISQALELYEKAYEMLKQIFEKNDTIDTRRDLTHSLLRLGNVLMIKGQLSEAEKYFKQHYEFVKDIADRTVTENARANLSVSMERLGELAKRKGNILEAEEYFHREFEIRKELLSNRNTITNRINLGVSLGHIGEIAITKGDIVKAEEFFKQQYEIFKELANEIQTVLVRRNLHIAIDRLGRIEMNKNRYDEAKKYFTESYEMCKSLANEIGTITARSDLIYSLYNLGDIALKKKDLKTAKEIFEICYEQRKAFADEIGTIQEFISLSYVIARLGDIEFKKRNFEKAEIYFNESYEINKRIAEQSQTIDNLDCLAFILERLGLKELATKAYDEAKRHFEEAYEIRKEIAEKTETLSAKLSLGFCLRLLGYATTANFELRDGVRYLFEASTIINNCNKAQKRSRKKRKTPKTEC